jgi:pimeloyl-ACP methyl ester carboxylesterase
MPLRSMEDLRAATRAAAGRESVTLAVSRDGTRSETTARVVPRPAEQLDGHEVRHEHVVAADGARLRTIVTRPLAPGPHPAVLYLQGIGRDSLDFGASPAAPIARLVHGWAASGLVTMRVEKRGVGDSDGDEADFDTEVLDDGAALAALRTDPAVRAGEIFVFGHSVGGMIAPLLAEKNTAGDTLSTGHPHSEENTLSTGGLAMGERPGVRGIVVYGTSAAPWFDCVAASTRRQLALRGAAEDEIERAVARERDEGFGVRTPRYHAQLQARDLAGAWDRAGCDALVVIGQHDWVVGEDEQRAVAERARSRGSHADVLELDGADHWMTRHASLEASLRDAGRGVFDQRLVTATAAWMLRRTDGSARDVRRSPPRAAG